MHRAAAVLVAVSLVACAKKRPRPNPAPCLAALFTVFDTVQTGGALEPKQQEALACSELYRHTACGEAWKRELALGAKLGTADEPHVAEKLPDPALIARACGKAYCAELSSKPILCNGPPPKENGALVEALIELDTAILLEELDDRGLAQGLATRARALRIVTVPMALPSVSTETSDAGAIIALEISADESITLDGRVLAQEDLERELGKLDGLSERRAVIRADRKASHGRVIEVMDALKRAGVRKIAFGVDPNPAPSAAASAGKRAE